MYDYSSEIIIGWKIPTDLWDEWDYEQKKDKPYEERISDIIDPNFPTIEIGHEGGNSYELPESTFLAIHRIDVSKITDLNTILNDEKLISRAREIYREIMHRDDELTIFPVMYVDEEDDDEDT